MISSRSRIIDISKILVLSMTFFWVPATMIFNSMSEDLSQNEITRHQKEMAFTSNLTKLLIKNNLLIEACDFLARQKNEGNIGAYAVKSDGFDCAEPMNVSVDSYKTETFGKVHSAKINEIVYEYQKDTNGKIQWVLAHIPPHQMSFLSYILANPKKMLWSIFVDSSLVLYVIFVFFIFYVVKNIDSIKRKFRKNERTPRGALERVYEFLNVSDFKEMKVIADSAINHIAELSKKLDYYDQTLEYAIESELEEANKKGEKILLPYKFEGTVVRIDINDYSAYCSEADRPFLRIMKRDFSYIAAEISYRHHGLFEGRAGDEVVYIFKGFDADLRANAFVRNFTEIFCQKRYDFSERKAIQFHVKSSISKSSLWLEDAPSKLSFDGRALEITNRMFGELPYKKENTLIILENYFSNIKRLSRQPFETRTISKKESTLSVSYINEQIGIDEILRTDIEALKYFLSDSDIIKQLEWIVSNDTSEAQKRLLLKNLSNNVRLRRSITSVVEVWVQTIRSFIKDYKNETYFSEFISSLISIGSVIFPSIEWNSDCTAVVKEAVQFLKERAPSNALDTLNKVGRHEDALNLTETIEGESSNRYKGSVLVTHAIFCPSDKIFNSLNKMIRSGNDNERHSGIYAACVIIEHYEINNPTQLKTYGEYLETHRLLMGALKEDVKLSNRVRTKLEKALRTSQN